MVLLLLLTIELLIISSLRCRIGRTLVVFLVDKRLSLIFLFLKVNLLLPTVVENSAERKSERDTNQKHDTHADYSDLIDESNALLVIGELVSLEIYVFLANLSELILEQVRKGHYANCYQKEERESDTENEVDIVEILAVAWFVAVKAGQCHQNRNG